MTFSFDRINGEKMIKYRRIRRDEWQLYKNLRLTSLRESPHAFSSTYESALQRSDESWQKQVADSSVGPDRATFIAFSNNVPVGIAALYRDSEHEDQGELLQVWVSPNYRGSTLAQDLLSAILKWGKENGLKKILAGITNGNERVINFYKKCGFQNILSSASDNTIVLECDLSSVRGTKR